MERDLIEVFVKAKDEGEDVIVSEQALGIEIPYLVPMFSARGANVVARVCCSGECALIAEGDLVM